MPSSAHSDLKPRVLSAFVIGPPVLLLAWFGGWPFVFLMLIASTIIYWEWVVMTVRSVDIRRDFLALFCVAALVMLSVLPDTQVVAMGLTIAVFATGLLVLRSGWKPGWIITGIGLAAGFAVPLTLVRSIPDLGFVYLVFLAFSVWGSDIFAFAIGRWLGGPKLAPVISPNKTWSGFFGGLVGAIVIGTLWARLMIGDQWLTYIGVALFVGLLAQLGDLLESYVKRHLQVKDSSNLIPGHGGLLDRVDSLVLSAYGFVLLYAIGLLSVSQGG